MPYFMNLPEDPFTINSLSMVAVSDIGANVSNITTVSLNTSNYGVPGNTIPLEMANGNSKAYAAVKANTLGLPGGGVTIDTPVTGLQYPKDSGTSVAVVKERMANGFDMRLVAYDPADAKPMFIVTPKFIVGTRQSVNVEDMDYIGVKVEVLKPIYHPVGQPVQSFTIPFTASVGGNSIAFTIVVNINDTLQTVTVYPYGAQQPLNRNQFWLFNIHQSDVVPLAAIMSPHVPEYAELAGNPIGYPGIEPYGRTSVQCMWRENNLPNDQSTPPYSTMGSTPLNSLKLYNGTGWYIVSRPDIAAGLITSIDAFGIDLDASDLYDINIITSVDIDDPVSSGHFTQAQWLAWCNARNTRIRVWTPSMQPYTGPGAAVWSMEARELMYVDPSSEWKADTGYKFELPGRVITDQDVYYATMHYDAVVAKLPVTLDQWYLTAVNGATVGDRTQYRVQYHDIGLVQKFDTQYGKFYTNGVDYFYIPNWIRQPLADIVTDPVVITVKDTQNSNHVDITINCVYRG